MAIKLAYIMSRFPKLSETFILREMNALRASGLDVSVYPLILEKTQIIHPEAKHWLLELHHFPWFSWGVFNANIRALLKNPLLYLAIWVRVIVGNITSPKFMLRGMLLFPKTVLMAEEMMRNGITHIHAHYATHPALVAWIINQLTGISYSITVHAHDIYVDRAMLSSKLNDAAFIVAISKFNQDFLSLHVGEWVRPKTYVVHCGIDLGIYAVTKSVVAAENFHVVSIGSLQPYKGMQYLIEACAALKGRGIPIRCTIIGDGEERENLEQLIDHLEVGDIVKLAGAKTQSEVASILRSAYCYAQPSVITSTGKMEGIPVALMEALASNLPSIASNLSGIPELIRNGETGYLVPPGDAQELANALEYVYKHPENAAKVAKAGRELVGAEFEIQKNIVQLAELFGSKLINS